MQLKWRQVWHAGSIKTRFSCGQSSCYYDLWGHQRLIGYEKNKIKKTEDPYNLFGTGSRHAALFRKKGNRRVRDRVSSEGEGLRLLKWAGEEIVGVVWGTCTSRTCIWYVRVESALVRVYFCLCPKCFRRATCGPCCGSVPTLLTIAVMCAEKDSKLSKCLGYLPSEWVCHRRRYLTEARNTTLCDALFNPFWFGCLASQIYKRLSTNQIIFWPPFESLWRKGGLNDFY